MDGMFWFGSNTQLALPWVTHPAYAGFARLYGAMALLTWGMSLLFFREYGKHEAHKARYVIFTLLTLLGFVGVIYSPNFVSLFAYFELMSLSSYVWVAQEESKEALRAAGTYLAISVIGGLVMLFGIMLLYADPASQRFSPYLTYGLLLFGFLAKAGVFPLHIWLPKAHPVAPAPASALLSGMLTKAGVFGVAMISFGVFTGDVRWARAMLFLGLITMLLGAVLALFSVNLKRTLACSSLSQIGFLMVGVGAGTAAGVPEGALARYGVLLHMVNHSLFKLVLFLCAGVVFMNLHKLDLNEIRGYGRNKTFLKVMFAIGALGISGVPLFSGYVSKTLLHEGILEASSALGGWARPAEWIFLISGGCTLAYMLKVFVAVFVEKGDEEVSGGAAHATDGFAVASQQARGTASVGNDDSSLSLDGKVSVEGAETEVVSLMGTDDAESHPSHAIDDSPATPQQSRDMVLSSNGGSLALDENVSVEGAEREMVSLTGVDESGEVEIALGNNGDDGESGGVETKKYMTLMSKIAIAVPTALIVVLGILPRLTMNRLAALGSDVLSGVPALDVSYFSWDNLKGGLVSIAIGLVLYFLFVRVCLMDDGHYRDYWPKRLDLEELLYRPLLLTVLPFIGTFFSRIADGAVDFIIVLLRKTIYTERAIPREYAEGNALTHLVGDTLDRRYRALRGDDLSPVDTYEHRLAMWYYRFSENRNIISRSLSFGLALASIGLLITLGYLLKFLLF